jgi:hypothetical protein
VKPADPFAGAKLSQSTQPQGRLDQQLFGSSPTPPTVSPPSEPRSQIEPSREQLGTVAEEQSRPPTMRDTVTAQPSAPQFDINDQPWHKDSFMLTDVEFERLHDLKLTLRRIYDLKVSKNDIVRAAVAHICTDFERDAERSILLRAMRKKRT